MTKAIAVDFAKYNVRVNCVSLGPSVSQNAQLIKKEQNLQQTSLLGDPVSEQQIANTVYFLLTEASSGITGASITVDGGLDCLIKGSY